jgi:hypothetical protein
MASLFAATLLLQTGVAAFADGDGPWTTNHPFAWGVASFPFRMLTGTAGAGFGALAGSAKGIVDTERKFSEHTFGEADKNPFMVPVGIAGAVVAVPVGVITGAPPGIVEHATKGYEYWDRF